MKYLDCLEMQNILFFFTIYSVWSQQCIQLSLIWAHNVIYTTIREISFTPMPILQYSTILHFYSSILVLGGMQSNFFHPSERGLHANLAIKRQHTYNLVINYIEDQQAKGQWVGNKYFFILLQVTLIIQIVLASQLNSHIL